MSREPGFLVRALLVLAALAAAPPAAGAAAAPPAPSGGSEVSIPAPARTVLKNGMAVLVLEWRSIPLVQLRLLVKAGATSDPEGKEGAAQLTARLLQRGTRTRGAQQFAEEVEFVGGTLVATSGLENTVVAGEFASKDFEIGLNLLADMVLNPGFKEEEFQKEKGLLLADLVAGLDDPERIADEAFAGWLYGAHPYGRPLQGTKRSVEALKREDIVAFQEARYAPNNALLAIVGDIGAAPAAQRAEHYFSAWKRRPVVEARLPEAPPVRGRRVLLVDKPDATQSQIRFGNIAIRRGDPDFFPLSVANVILGRGFTSWLVDELRVKRGLTYFIRSQLNAERATGSFEVTTFSKNPTVLETIDVSLDLIRRLKSGPAPGPDLERARNYLAGTFPLQIESPDELAAQILEVEFYGLPADSINQFQRRVRAVDPDGLKRASARLPLDDLAIVVVGPAASLKEPLGKLGPVTVRPILAPSEAP